MGIGLISMPLDCDNCGGDEVVELKKMHETDPDVSFTELLRERTGWVWRPDIGELHCAFCILRSADIRRVRYMEATTGERPAKRETLHILAEVEDADAARKAKWG